MTLTTVLFWLLPFSPLIMFVCLFSMCSMNIIVALWNFFFGTFPLYLVVKAPDFLLLFIQSNWSWQGFWRGNVPALLMVMPYTAIQFAVLQKVKTFASGSSKTGILSTDQLLLIRRFYVFLKNDFLCKMKVLIVPQYSVSVQNIIILIFV